MKYVYFINYSAESGSYRIKRTCEITFNTRIKNIQHINSISKMIEEEYSYLPNSCVIHNYKFLRFKLSFGKSS